MTNYYDASLDIDLAQPLHSTIPGDHVSKKRKRGGQATCPKEGEQIQIEGAANGPSKTLKTICLLRRCQLPLSFLDVSDHQDRLFTAHIPTLESHNVTEEDGTSNGSRILIAEESDTGRLYAIERVRHRLYAILQLGSWVDGRDLEARSRQSSPRKRRQVDVGKSADLNQAWWELARVKGGAEGAHEQGRTNQRLRLSVLKPTEGKDAEEARSGLSNGVALAIPAHGPKQEPVAEIRADNNQGQEQTPEQSIEQLISQYLETLYRTRTSLAYFVKGPIARIRSAFTKNASTGITILTEYLEGLLLPSTLFDKKYRDVLLAAIKDLPLRMPDEEIEAPPRVVKKESKKRKKLRIDKEGLLPTERDSIAFWWRSDDEVQGHDESMEQQIRRRLVRLRTREACLQIILILEVLALKHSKAAEDATEDTQTDNVLVPKDGQKGRKRKTANLPEMLEVLLDKLCIWHSLDHGIVSGSPEKTTDTQKAAPDHLRNFCIEVIIPFFASRLPDRATTVIKKLGGPSAPSPAKERNKPRKAGQSQTQSKQERKPREPLHRIASERVGQPNKVMPALARAATDSFAQTRVKRESSEVSLDRIPFAQNRPQTIKQTTALDRMRVKHREVDFDAMTQAQEAKKKKQAEIDQKVREAINGIKKPNREAAGRAVVEATEQRLLMAQARAKAQAKASRVQIDATPKHGRTKDYALAETPRAGMSNEARHPTSSSTVSMVPSSSIRPRPVYPAEEEVPQTDHRPRYQHVEATPVQKPAGFARPALPPVRPFPLSTTSANKSVLETPRHQRTMDVCAETPPQHHAVDAVDATPIKKLVLQADAEATPRKEQETNIYEALGWND